MGIFSHEKIYSHKFLNAEITDSADRVHVVPIKRILGDFFVTKIDRQTYVFRIKGPIYTYHALGMRTVRKIYYNTAHYRPVSQAQYKKLEKVIDINGLPKLDRPLFDVLKYLGKRERVDFEQHDIQTVFETLAQHESRYQQEAQNMRDFLNHLGIDHIVTPVKKITEFIEGDLIATDPQFFGDVIPAYQRLDAEDKKITNTPQRGKGPWLKILVIAMISTAILAFIIWAISSGAFNNLTSSFGGLIPSSGPQTVNEWAAKYPSPESLRIAVDNGQVDPNKLPADMKKMLDSFKPPTVTPKSTTVELTP